ncbi:MAG: hypothetical protein SFU99_10530 [Saprospiraceae bacterium]|nr:hypothetical protein [Saprospiraceae bacterium]
MRKKSLLLFTLLLSVSLLTNGLAQSNSYRYSLDLRKVEDDKLQIELITPEIKQSSIKFFMPKIIPGTYMFADYGRFVSDFKAFDANGNALAVTHPDANTWEIPDAKNLHKITYRVMDTFDADVDGPTVYGMSGTNFEAGENFVFDVSGLFGYFEGMKEQAFEVKIAHPENFYGSTPLIAANSDKISDTYQLENYGRLIDSPMLYCQPDTATVQVGNTQVLVSVYYESERNVAPKIAAAFKSLLAAQGQFLGGTLPVKKYAFLMHFQKPGEFRVGQGALEHSYSSLYHLTEGPLDQMMPFLMDIAAHEFFHIITPLNLHSEEIRYFNFNEPKLSQHLWLYEGVTEYFAHQAQLAGGLMPMDRYLSNMNQKIIASQAYYTDNLSFTEMSKQCADKYANEYGNVYQKGALIGLCLDIKLRQLSDGKEGLVDLVFDLTKKYGKDKPFKDDKLFKDIRKMRGREIEDFFQTYVEGDTPIPYQEFLRLVGIEYQGPQDYMDFSVGGLGYDPASSTMVIFNEADLDAFGKAMGYKRGDKILKFNGKAVPKQGIGAFIDELKSEMKEGEDFEATVLRRDESGAEKETTLRTKLFKVSKKTQAKLNLMENTTSAQLALREAWMRGNAKP